MVVLLRRRNSASPTTVVTGTANDGSSSQRALYLGVVRNVAFRLKPAPS